MGEAKRRLKLVQDSSAVEQRPVKSPDGGSSPSPAATPWRRSERELKRAADTEIILATGKGQEPLTSEQIAERAELLKSPENEAVVTKVGGRKYIAPKWMNPLMQKAMKDYQVRVNAGYKGSFKQFLEDKANAKGQH